MNTNPLHNDARIVNKQMLQSILHNFVIPTFIIDKDHQVIYWNHALEEISQIPAEEVIGTNQHWRAFYASKRPCMADLIIDGNVKKISKWYAEKGSKSKLIEDAFEATDFFPELGEKGKWLRFTASALRDSSGNLIGAVETLEDITEHKRVDEEREKLVAELQEALSKIKILKGLLPICAACKKIRNDKGYWEQIESFIRAHSEADFSHGICPECAQKLYPKFFKKRT